MMSADALYHRLFSHPLMLRQLIDDFVPEAAGLGLDFSAMNRVSAKFHADPDGTRREADVIWRIPLRDGSEIYLYIMLEFQSRIDPWMAVRVQTYQGLLWQQIIQSQRLGVGDRLPPLLTVVLYNGAPTWSAPVQITDLIDLPAASPLWPWQPQSRYYLLDMGRIPGNRLVQQETLSALLFRLEQRQEPEQLAQLINQVIGWFRHHPGYDDLRRLFTHLIRQAMHNTGMVEPLPEELQEMRTMLATLGEEWRRSWKEQGLAEGRAEGREQGRAEGRVAGRAEGQAESLLRLVHRRFGPVPAEAEAMVRAASLEQLDHWLDRILDAETLTDLLQD